MAADGTLHENQERKTRVRIVAAAIPHRTFIYAVSYRFISHHPAIRTGRFAHSFAGGGFRMANPMVKGGAETAALGTLRRERFPGLFRGALFAQGDQGRCQLKKQPGINYDLLTTKEEGKQNA
jgi:hypothetical protein